MITKYLIIQLCHGIIISSQNVLCLILLTGIHISAPGSFLFSLRNKDNLAPFQAPLKNEDSVFAMYRIYGYGPTFGIGHDLYIANYAGSNIGSYPNFGATYNVPPGYTWALPNTLSLLAGSLHFSPSAVEILYLN